MVNDDDTVNVRRQHNAVLCYPQTGDLPSDHCIIMYISTLCHNVIPYSSCLKPV